MKNIPLTDDFDRVRPTMESASRARFVAFPSSEREKCVSFRVLLSAHFLSHKLGHGSRTSRSMQKCQDRQNPHSTGLLSCSLVAQGIHQYHICIYQQDEETALPKLFYSKVRTATYAMNICPTFTPHSSQQILLRVTFFSLIQCWARFFSILLPRGLIFN
jgi:hypothetical protein